MLNFKYLNIFKLFFKIKNAKGYGADPCRGCIRWTSAVILWLVLYLLPGWVAKSRFGFEAKFVTKKAKIRRNHKCLKNIYKFKMYINTDSKISIS